MVHKYLSTAPEVGITQLHKWGHANTEQQESSVLATINLEKQKWKIFDESYSLFFLLLNVCTYVHDCDLTPIWCRRHLLTQN